jgi:hypothetical protein
MENENNYELRFLSLDTSINFVTNDKNLVELMKSLYPRRILPNFKIENNIHRNDIFLSYFLENSLIRPEIKFKENDDFINLYISSPSYSPGEVPFLMLQLLEYFWEKRVERYIVEASSVAIGDKAILLLGPSGSGKTLIALEMWKRGYEFLSNENTVINHKDQVIGGTTVVNLKEFVADLYPEIKDVAKETYSVSGVKRYLIEFPQPLYGRNIVGIIKIQAFTDSDHLKVREVGQEELGFLLYEFPSKLIRGVLSPVGRFCSLSLDLDTRELAEKRMKKFFNMNLQAYSLYGNYKRIGDWIERFYEIE